MERQNSVQLTTQDILRFLQSEGVDIPKTSSPYMHMDEDGLNLEVRWSETIRPKVRHPEDALSHFSQQGRHNIKEAMERGDRLAAIKHVRAEGQAWTLMSAKDWVLKHYPSN